MSRKKIAKDVANYHHGDLRAAILQVAERILRRDGIKGLSLRACARETGVSHMGPAHHFSNLSTLYSELAASGFERLAGALFRAVTEDWKPGDTSWAYITFALENKELFYLMNDPGRLDSSNPALKAGRSHAYSALGRARSIPLEHLSLDQAGLLTRTWALSHGLALLMLSGRLGGILKLAPAGTTDRTLVQAALSALTPC